MIKETTQSELPPGFQTAEATDVAVRLGEDTYLTFNLQLEAATGEILAVSGLR